MESSDGKKCKNGQKSWAKNPPQKKSTNKAVRQRTREVNRKYK